MTYDKHSLRVVKLYMEWQATQHIHCNDCHKRNGNRRKETKGSENSN